jgi:hypothetical protein
MGERTSRIRKPSLKPSLVAQSVAKSLAIGYCLPVLEAFYDSIEGIMAIGRLHTVTIHSVHSHSDSAAGPPPGDRVILNNVGLSLNTGHIAAADRLIINNDSGDNLKVLSNDNDNVRINGAAGNTAGHTDPDRNTDPLIHTEKEKVGIVDDIVDAIVAGNHSDPFGAVAHRRKRQSKTQVLSRFLEDVDREITSSVLQGLFDEITDEIGSRETVGKSANSETCGGVDRNSREVGGSREADVTERKSNNGGVVGNTDVGNDVGTTGVETSTTGVGTTGAGTTGAGTTGVGPVGDDGYDDGFVAESCRPDNIRNDSRGDRRGDAGDENHVEGKYGDHGDDHDDAENGDARDENHVEGKYGDHGDDHDDAENADENGDENGDDGDQNDGDQNDPGSTTSSNPNIIIGDNGVSGHKSLR